MTAERQKAATQADLDSFYDQTMNVYCAVGRDTILQLPKGSKFGGFATHPDLHWSKAQQTAWRATRQAPIRLNSLAPQDALVMSTLHASIAQATNGMPKISPADFKRLQETPRATFSIWRVGSEWTLLLPKAVFEFTDAQRRAYEDGTIKADGSNAPNLESCFKAEFVSSGRNGFDYEICRVSISEILEDEKRNRITVKNPQQWWEQMMDQCCEKRSGLFVLLPPNNPVGDLIHTESHLWTDDQVKAWKNNKVPPYTNEDLPPDTQVLVHHVHFPRAHTSDKIRVSPEDFKKLNQAIRPCVSAWIVSENDALIMWTTDIEFTEQEKADFREGKIKEDLSNAPLLSECIKEVQE